MAISIIKSRYRYLFTTNDVALFSNAPNISDYGQVIGDDTWDAAGGYHTTAIDLRGSLAKLTIGGNYGKTLTGEDNTATISSGVGPTDLPTNYNVFFRGYNLRNDIYAIKFAASGYLYLTSQTGYAEADTYYIDGGNPVEKSDDNIKIRVEHVSSWTTTGNSFSSSYDTNIRDVVAVTIYAAGSLTVGSSLSGQISAQTNASFEGVTHKPNSDYVAVDVTSSLQANALVFQAGSMVINGNMRGKLDAETNLAVKAWYSVSMTGNEAHAYGIKLSGNLSATGGQWTGRITAISSGTVMEALAEDILGIGTAAPVTTPGAMNNHKIFAIGLSANAVTLREMVGSNWDEESTVYNFWSEANDNTLEITVRGGTNDTTLNISGNTIAAYGIEASSLAVSRNIEAGATFYISASGNTISGSFETGKTRTLTKGSNYILAAAIKTGSFTVREFQGSITVDASDNTITYGGYSNVIAYDAGMTVAGIQVSGLFTVTHNLGGTFTVSADNNNVWANRYIETYGIKAANLTVTGRIDSDITVTCNNNTVYTNSYAAIGIGIDSSLTASAFAGTIVATGMYSIANVRSFGINVRGSLNSGIVGDAFDMTGSITAGGGILVYDQLNLRVSGNIAATTSGYAILAESYYNAQTGTMVTKASGGTNDKVELADGAEVTGIIDLGLGTNTVYLNSGAKLNGMLIATDGKMNVTFLLDETVLDRAIVVTQYVQPGEVSDSSLDSGASISLNLNYAKSDSTYILYQYSGAGTKLDSFWGGKFFTLAYNDETEIVELAWNATTERYEGTRSFGSDASITIWYDSTAKQIKAQTGTITPPPAFDLTKLQPSGSYSAGSDEATNTYTIQWVGSGSADPTAAYEIEYVIYDKDNNPYGKSIVVRIDGRNNAANYSHVISGLNAGDRITWRIRRDIDGNGTTVTRWTEREDEADTGKTVSTFISMSNASTMVINPEDPTAGTTSSVSKLSWDAARADHAVSHYVVTYVGLLEPITEDRDDILGDTVEKKISHILAGNDPRYTVYTKTVTAREAIISRLTDRHYIYWQVTAVDVNGNTSAAKIGEVFRAYQGDETAPVFIQNDNAPLSQVSVSYDRTDPYDVKITAEFSWKAAYDAQSGLNAYIVEIRQQIDGEWQEWDDAVSHTVSHSNQAYPGTDYPYAWNTGKTPLAGGQYQYRIYAIDYAGNRSSYLTGSFGNADTAPPEGLNKFTKLNKPTVIASWSEAVVDEETGTIITPAYLQAVDVAFTWEDDYTDDSGVVYRFQFSDSASFNSDNTYVVESFESLGKVLNIATSEPTRSPSIFANMGTVYWRVMAVDTAGNSTGEWSTVQSFEFVDQNGTRLSHQAAPAKPYDLKITIRNKDYANTGYVTNEWHAAHTDLGISSFDFIMTSKDGGDTFTWTFDYDSFRSTDPASSTLGYSRLYFNEDYFLSDGTYTWQVISYNALGRSTKSDTYSFVIDTKRPDAVGLNSQEPLIAAAIGNAIVVNWFGTVDRRRDENKSIIANGIAGYDIYYRIEGTETWTLANASQIAATKADQYSYIITGLQNTNYEVAVYAWDKNGNRSEASILTVSVDNASDLPDSLFDAAGIPEFADEADEQGVLTQTIGITDTADWFGFDAAQAGTLTIDVLAIDSLYGSKGGSITITIGEYDPSRSDGFKVTKTYTVKAATGSSPITLTLPAASTRDAYFVRITPSDVNSGTRYSLGLDYAPFPTNVNDNTWSQAYGGGTDKTYHLAIKYEDGVTNPPITGSFSDWVGFGDAVDYRYFDINMAGIYDFSIHADNSEGASVKMTIVQVGLDGKEKALKSVTAKAGQTAPIADLLVSADAAVGSYYIKVESVSGKNTKYDVTATLKTPFSEADPDNNSETNPGGLIFKATEDGGKNIDDWVGFGNATDYFQVLLTDPTDRNTFHAGSYTITIAGVTEKVKLTLWEIVQTTKNGVTTEKNKALKSATVSPKNGAPLSGGITLLLDPNTMDPDRKYYVTVEATGAAKGLNTKYSLALDGTQFINEYTAKDNNVWNGAEVNYANFGYDVADDDYSREITGEWVGFGDAVDFFQISLEYSGLYDFNFSVSEKTKFTIYEITDSATGKKKAVKSITLTATSAKPYFEGLLLDASKRYVLEVVAPGAKTAKNSDYSASIAPSQGNEAASIFNNQYNSLDNNVWNGTEVNENGFGMGDTFTSTLSGDWVGFGDAVDFFQISLDHSGLYDFNFTVTGQTKFTVYEITNPVTGAKKAVKSITLTASSAKPYLQGLLLDANKQYVLEVVAPGAKTAKNSDYTVALTPKDGNSDNVFDNLNTLDDNWNDVKATVGFSNGIASFDDWVGYGDAVDWFKLSTDGSGGRLYGVSFSPVVANAAKMTIYRYDESTSKLVKVSLDKNSQITLMADTTYAIQIVSADNGKGAKNTGYSLAVNAA